MRKLLIVVLFCVPAAAWAGHLDVIKFTLKEDCSLDSFLAIKEDFNNNWGKDHGYHAELAVPIQDEDVYSLYWLGRSADTAAFGAAYDAWEEQIKDPNSVAGQLNARLLECNGPWGGRYGYKIH